MLKKLSFRVLIMAVMIVSLSAFVSFAKPGWHEDKNGWWYEFSDGTYPYGDAYMINGVMYVFNSAGYMYSNCWVEFMDGSWCYCTADGPVAKDCWIGNYYVDKDGFMLTNSYTPDGYYVGPDGKWDPDKTSSSTKDRTVSEIPVGYYDSIDVGWDTKDYYIDAQVYTSGSDKILHFAHKETTGSNYSYYDSSNPNGDDLVLYKKDGQIYGESTKDGAVYEVSYSGSALTVYWVNVIWDKSTSSSSTIKMVYRGTTNSSKTSTSGYNTEYDDGRGLSVFDVDVTSNGYGGEEIRVVSTSY